nr:hypothetical protein CFP56_09120 [Quercus suber]
MASVWSCCRSASGRYMMCCTLMRLGLNCSLASCESSNWYVLVVICSVGGRCWLGPKASQTKAEVAIDAMRQNGNYGNSVPDKLQTSVPGSSGSRLSKQTKSMVSMKLMS